MPDLRPYLGWGFAGLSRQLKEKIDDIEETIANLVLGEVTASTVEILDEGNHYTSTNVEGALQEAAVATSAKYELPVDGIPYTDLSASVQASLDKANTALQGTDAITAIRANRVQLAGHSPTKISFQNDTAATLTGTETEPFALAHGNTFIVAVDGGSGQTVTFQATAGYHTGGSNPLTDLTAETDNKFKIQVDDDATPRTVTCDWTGCTTGALTAAQMQTQIRALGGVYASVTVAYSTDHYVITSGSKGTGSKVRITRADDHDVCDELKIGPNGTNTDGTGDAVNIAAATINEVVTKLNASLTGATASGASGAVKLTSNTAGSTSSLVIGAGTANTALGFTENQTDYGADGLGYTSDMADANYIVAAMLSGTAQNALASKALSVRNKAVSGFELECETAAATDYVDLIVVGKAA